MIQNGDLPSDEESQSSPELEPTHPDAEPADLTLGGPAEASEASLKPALKKPRSEPPLEVKRPQLPEQPDPKTLDLTTLTPLSPEIISRQATINIGTIGHVAHGKSTVVKAISGVQTVRFKNELERNITIKLGYANAKIYKCDNEACPRPTCYRSYKSEKEVDPPCERDGCEGTYRLLRHISFVDCPGHDILMSTMLSGAAVMDAALLLIAGNETCPQPQTSEHLAAIEIMKLNHVIILQNKVDLMKKDDAQTHNQSILKFIRGTVADKSPVIPISAQLKYNIDAINEALVTKIPVPLRDFTKPPHMMIIRSFDVNKPGAEIEELKGGVAGGSILAGVLRLGDEIEIRPGLVKKDSEGKVTCTPIFSRIVSLFAEHNDLKFAVPGGLIGKARPPPLPSSSPPIVNQTDRLPPRYRHKSGSHPLPRRPAGRARARPQRHAAEHLHRARGELFPATPAAGREDGGREAGESEQAVEGGGYHGEHWVDRDGG